MEVYVKNWEGSIPRSVAIATVKTYLKCIAFMTPSRFLSFLGFLSIFWNLQAK